MKRLLTLTLVFAGASAPDVAEAKPLTGCTVVVLPGGAFSGLNESLNAAAVRDLGARVIVQKYPVRDVPGAYRSVNRPRSVLLGESAGGAIAAWAAAHRRARAAVTIGAPLDFRLWQPDPSYFPGTPWHWSPLRVYHGQRPLTTIQWTRDPIVPANQPALHGARRITLKGLGHQGAPRSVLRRELRRACATPGARRPPVFAL